MFRHHSGPLISDQAAFGHGIVEPPAFLCFNRSLYVGFMESSTLRGDCGGFRRRIQGFGEILAGEYKRVPPFLPIGFGQGVPPKEEQGTTHV